MVELLELRHKETHLISVVVDCIVSTGTFAVYKVTAEKLKKKKLTVNSPVAAAAAG